MKKDLYREYCTGCGLCSSIFDNVLTMDSDGFPKVQVTNQNLLHFCENVCPANGKHLSKQEDSSWGRYVNVYEGYALDNVIRFKAASGGVTTAVAVYLLETKKVDGVIQIGASKNPYETKVYCSTTKEEIIAHSASRYIASSPLEDFIKIVSRGKLYAFVGRPCDIIVLNNFLQIEPQYKNNIFCTLSFFCAGAPSMRASQLLAETLSVEPNEVASIQYRGNGWPGKATVISKDGIKHEMDYIDSWNNILGRDIRKICKFCTDGVGEVADISSGDLWYLDTQNKPLFDERPGRNVTFARSKIGNTILKDAMKQGYVHLTSYEEHLNELKFVQPNHAVRKQLLYPRCMAMKLMNKSVPNFNMKQLKSFSKKRGIKNNTKTFLGTIKRILQRKL